MVKLFLRCSENSAGWGVAANLCLGRAVETTLFFSFRFYCFFHELRNEVLNIKKLILKERKKIAESKPVAAANVGGISVEEFKKFQ
jgi:hypothetical protein